MRLIFLDVDGVLNSSPSGGEIEPSRLQILRRIVHGTGACVVLSSAWRVDHYEVVEAALRAVNVELIGKTDYYAKGTAQRPLEITAWLTAAGSEFYDTW